MWCSSPPDRPCDVRILTAARTSATGRSGCASSRSSISRSRRARTRASARSATRRSGRRSSSRTGATTSSAASPSPRPASPSPRPRRCARASSAGRDATSIRPRWSRPARPTARQRDDGRRVAAFAGEVDPAAGRGGEDRRRVRPGAEPRPRRWRRPRASSVAEAEADLAATRASWAARLGKVEVRTNRPDFDRLVNTWLPYQLYASRLLGPGRAEPARRRDRLSATSCRTCCR